MKKNLPLIITAVVLSIIVGLLLFTFQVRRTEVAVVTRFGKVARPSANATLEPGIHFRLPWPIEMVYKFENRIQTFDKKFEQTTTRDGRPLIITVFVGWRIANPQLFLESFDKGDYAKAEQTLENVVRNAKNGVLGQHPFGDLISTDPAKLKFDQIESEMLASIKSKAEKEYGIEVDLLGIKQLGLPEPNTQAVFNRMSEERNVLVKQYAAEGEAEARKIKAEAERKSTELISQAEAKETEILGQAEAEASKYLAVFDQNPEFAAFVLRLRAIEAALKERTTLILDQQTPPFDMLQKKSIENTGKMSK